MIKIYYYWSVVVGARCAGNSISTNNFYSISVCIYLITLRAPSKTNTKPYVNPTLYGVAPLKKFWSLEPSRVIPKCWQNYYMILKIDFLRLKITYFFVLRGQHVHLTPQKCFLEAYSTKCPWNAWPRKYPEIRSPYEVGLTILWTTLCLFM